MRKGNRKKGGVLRTAFGYHTWQKMLISTLTLLIIWGGIGGGVFSSVGTFLQQKLHPPGITSYPPRWHDAVLATNHIIPQGQAGYRPSLGVQMKMEHFLAIPKLPSSCCRKECRKRVLAASGNFHQPQQHQLWPKREC